MNTETNEQSDHTTINVDFSHAEVGLSQTQVSSQNPCPHCGGLFKGTHGVAIHISRAHPPNTDNLF